MLKQRRIARGFLILACLLIITCLAQRVASLRALQLPVHASVAVSQSLAPHDTRADAPVSSCEFSAKSLATSVPLLADVVVLGLLSVLITLFAAPRRLLRCLPPLPERFPPRCRRHLELCILRE